MTIAASPPVLGVYNILSSNPADQAVLIKIDFLFLTVWGPSAPFSPGIAGFATASSLATTEIIPLSVSANVGL